MNIEEVIKRNFRSISDEYKQFCVEKDQCRECDLYNCYKQVVQSEGNGKDPTFMIICESPGKVEVEQQRPLIGPAGQELRKTLRKYNFNRGNTILTNVVPCRPKNNKLPNKLESIYDCLDNNLYEEIKILKPKIIITCGAPAIKAIRHLKCRLSSNRGIWFFIERFKAWSLATWHPSYTLRCKNDPAKSHVPLQFEEDFKKVNSEWFHLMNGKEMKMKDKTYDGYIKDKHTKELNDAVDVTFTSTTTNTANSFYEIKKHWENLYYKSEEGWGEAL